MKKAYLEKLASVLQTYAPDETIFVCASRAEGRRMLAAVAGTGAVLVGVRAETPFTLARELCAGRLSQPDAPRLVEEVEGAELVRGCLGENSGIFSGVNAKTLSATRAFYRAFQEISLAGHPADLTGNEALQKISKLQDLQNLRMAYINKKKEESLIDRADLFAMALQEAEGEHPLRRAHFVVLGDYAVTPVERRLLELVSAPDRLAVVDLPVCKDLTAIRADEQDQYLPIGAWAKELPRVDVLQTLKNGASRYVGCRGIETEVRFPLRDILNRELPLEECAIVYLGGSYGQSLYEEAARFYMPVTAGGGLPLMDSRLYTTLKKIRALPKSDYYAEDVCALLEAEYCTPEWPVKLAERLRRKKVGWSRERYALACEYEAEELGKPGTYTTADWQKLLGKWQKFLTLLLELAAPSGELKQQKEDLKTFLTEYCYQKNTVEASACAKARNLAERIIALEEGETALQRLISLMETASHMAGGAEPGKLYIAPLSQAACINRKYLYVIGFSRYALQGVRQESPILLDAEREALGNLKTSIQQGREHEFRLLTLLARHEGEYILTYPDFISDGMLEQEPAPFFRDAAGGKVERVTYIPDEICLPADRLLTADRAYICRPEARESGVGEGIALQQPKSVRKLLEEMEFSATSLEDALKCPYSFYLKRLLRVRAPQVVERNDEQWLNPMDIGTFCHKVLEEYYNLPAGADWEPVFEEQFVRLKHDVPLPQADLEAPTREHLRAVVQRAIEWTAAQGRTVKATEEDFHMLPLQFGSWIINMQGSIDRVDELPDGSIAILDYKTGNPDNYKNDPYRHWQHYLYTVAEETLHSQRRVDRAGYLFLQEEAELMEHPENDDLREETAARIEWLLDRISAPDYAWECIPGFKPKTTDDDDPNLPPPKPVMLEPDPHGGSASNCRKYCEFYEICPRMKGGR